jgi:hypothetical protein
MGVPSTPLHCDSAPRATAESNKLLVADYETMRTHAKELP